LDTRKANIVIPQAPRLEESMHTAAFGERRQTIRSSPIFARTKLVASLGRAKTQTNAQTNSPSVDIDLKLQMRLRQNAPGFFR
jgi:hypothetical protein